MSLTNHFLESYVGNPKHLDMLRAILDLNQYEALSFCALALAGESNAVRISDTSGIPRSKIYSSLESLKNKGLIVENHGVYKVDTAKVGMLPHEVEALAESFQKFVEKLALYSTTSAAKVQATKSMIREIISRSGYHSVPFDREMREDERDQAIVFMDRWYYTQRRVRAARSYSDFRSILKTLDEREYLLDELAESSTSGIKIAVSIISEEKVQVDSGRLSQMLLFGALGRASGLGCEAVIFILLPEAQSLLHVAFTDFPPHPRVYLIPAHEPTLEKTIAGILKDFDRNWMDSKREVDKIGGKIMDLKMQLTSTLDSTYKHVRDVSEKGGKHKERYLEILERIQADLIASEDSLSTIRKDFERISERLEASRTIPDSSMIADIEKRVDVLRDDLQRKIQARDQLLEDILAHMRGGKAYVEYGYVTNPFVFTVPPEYPRDIVDQGDPRTRFERFVTDMIKGSSHNLIFVFAEEGMGKTHFLNFYAKSVNDKKFGQAIALRLNCKPRSDIIDLYAQISIYASRLTDSKILKKEILKVLETSGTPKNVTDFISVLRSLNSSITDSGFQGMFLMIDDFENTLPSGETTITPRSILQLTELAKLENMGIVVAMRENSWQAWNKEIRGRIPRVGKHSIIKLGRFGPSETYQLLKYRVEEKDEKGAKEPPQFSEGVSAKICEKGQGIPRRIISIAREVFRIAILENKTITIALVDAAAG